MDEGYRLLRKAYTIQLDRELPDLSVELWFYRLAHRRTGAERLEAIVRLRQLVAAGARSPGWNLEPTVSRAVSDGHEDARWLPILAQVITEGADAVLLEEWPAWRDAI